MNGKARQRQRQKHRRFDKLEKIGGKKFGSYNCQIFSSIFFFNFSTQNLFSIYHNSHVPVTAFTQIRERTETEGVWMLDRKGESLASMMDIIMKQSFEKLKNKRGEG